MLGKEIILSPFKNEKKFTYGPEIFRDDLALIASDSFKPLLWKTGRVMELRSGNDKIIRVVKQKTFSGEKIEPGLKLRNFPIE